MNVYVTTDDWVELDEDVNFDKFMEAFEEKDAVVREKKSQMQGELPAQERARRYAEMPQARMRVQKRVP